MKSWDLIEMKKNYPYSAQVFTDYYEKNSWAQCQFGIGFARWFLLGNFIYFKHEADCNWFMLRWV